jgi:hypothetical protein
MLWLGAGITGIKRRQWGFLIHLFLQMAFATGRRNGRRKRRMQIRFGHTERWPSCEGPSGKRPRAIPEVAWSAGSTCEIVEFMVHSKIEPHRLSTTMATAPRISKRPAVVYPVSDGLPTTTTSAFASDSLTAISASRFAARPLLSLAGSFGFGSSSAASHWCCAHFRLAAQSMPADRHRPEA